MNFTTAQPLVRKACLASLLLAGIFLAAVVRADAPEPGRFLLVFETSPALKKNLPAVKQTLDELFASNLQHAMRENDDLAVWTVDQDLHTGTFPLASWSPEDAEMYASRLNDFLGRQKYSRHANLAAVQPLLNRIVKNSPQLTVLIICDGQSNLLGTPYDGEVNAILKKAAKESQGVTGLFVIVLRSYQGEYLGSSVNRMPGSLVLPQFPPPPKPEPPAIKPAPVAVAPVPVPPPAPITAPAPVSALIIVGTNVGNDVSVLTNKPAPPPAINAAVPNAPEETAKVMATLPKNPNLDSNPPPATKFVPERVAAPAAVVAPIAATHPPAATNAAAVGAADTDNAADSGSQKLIFIGSGLLLSAVGLVVWLATRSRRPVGSLITSSMQDDPQLRPRK